MKSGLFFILYVFWCTLLHAQVNSVTLSGKLKAKQSAESPAFINILLKKKVDSGFVTGTISKEDGSYVLTGVKPGSYFLQISSANFQPKNIDLFVGSLAEFLVIPTIELEPATKVLSEVSVTGKTEEVNTKLDKKVINVSSNITQTGGSILQVMQTLPGVTVQDGKILIRGSDKVAVLVDGKQTALTGFGAQTSLDNIPASAIERIEIINNPSAKYDANGNAGIINIIFKKNKKEGWSGKIGMTTGLGAIWEKRANLPTIRPQFQGTPKLNPSASVNYRKNKINWFLQGDYYYNPTLNKNEFVDRYYDNGDTIYQQTKRNRKTTVVTGRTGFDWNISSNNLFSSSVLYSREKILDNGDEPFFKSNLNNRTRLWQFLEDEVKTTVTAMNTYQHKFDRPGEVINVGLNYTFHREDEKYFFTNSLPTYTGLDSFKLLSDEHVTDFTFDYIRPLRYGKLETGVKYRWRNIPTNMKFKPGINSPLDVNAGGWATYKEDIPAIYSNYSYETAKWEAEAGLRMEYVRVRYLVDPNHNTYKSDGYQYTQPFPSMRLAYKFDAKRKLSLFFNRRVDRPAELDIRVFPKYDDAEIIKVGNPALKPQYTNSVELAFRANRDQGYFYAALYHRFATGTITRIGTIVPGSTIIYNGMQNAGRSFNTGIELVYSGKLDTWLNYTLNVNGYHNQINAFSAINLYPTPITYTSEKQEIYSGSIKLNLQMKIAGKTDVQVAATYLAPDLIPQGRIEQRFGVDAGLKRSIQKGKAEFFINATDLFNTMIIRKHITGGGFNYTSADYYETQVVRVGYALKF